MGAGHPDRWEALRALGTGDAAYAGLAALTLEERAALVAGDIERLGASDLQLVLGTDAAGSHRLLKRARTRYLASVLATRSRREPAGDLPGTGELARNVDGIASRAVGQRAPR